MSAPRERPILFSAPMVRAILAGTKAQTRRVVKTFDHRRPLLNYLGRTAVFGCSPGVPPEEVHCPFGQPGDKLWVKETWRPEIVHTCAADPCDCVVVRVRYAADGVERTFWDEGIGEGWSWPKAAKRGNVSSLLMPRWASRITLEITEVRVQRLQDISEADAIAEGAMEWAAGLDDPRRDMTCSDARILFASLWCSINGAESWSSNPWVWAVSFKRVEMSR